MSLPKLYCDDDWLDLNVGDQAIIHGKVQRLASGILLTMSDWSQMSIEASSQGPEGFISLIVERTEDGIKEVPATA